MSMRDQQLPPMHLVRKIDLTDHTLALTHLADAYQLELWAKTNRPDEPVAVRDEPGCYAILASGVVQRNVSADELRQIAPYAVLCNGTGEPDRSPLGKLAGGYVAPGSGELGYGGKGGLM